MRIFIVADDLTGALDVAGPFAQRGLLTSVVVDAGQDWPAAVADARVVCVNADSRHLPAAQAAVKLAEILRRVDTRAQVLLKKIDSTLRGQVVAETLAMMRAAGRATAVVAPAFPAQGRTVRGGVVHVNGVPLADTAFARDALSPPPTLPLQDVFSRADAAVAARSVVTLDGNFSSAEGERVLVLDTQVDDDLAAAVRCAGGALDQVLWVGAAGIARALAAHCQDGVPAQRVSPRTSGRILLIAGSRAEATREQINRLMEDRDIEILDAPNGAVDTAMAQASRAPVLVLRATPGPAGEGDADAVAEDLGRAADGLLRRGDINIVIATGGDTARAILAAAGTAVVEVMGDLLPGIPYSLLRRDGRDIWLITKAGGFGTRDTFAQLIGLLRAQGCSASMTR